MKSLIKFVFTVAIVMLIAYFCNIYWLGIIALLALYKIIKEEDKGE